MNLNYLLKSDTELNKRKVIKFNNVLFSNENIFYSHAKKSDEKKNRFKKKKFSYKK